MRSLVVYYSRTGNTKRVADTLASNLKSDVEEIVDHKDRQGMLGYLSTSWDMLFNREAAIRPAEKDPSDYDLVVVGTPIWGWKVSSPVRKYLTLDGTGIKRAAFFCTMGGNGESQVFVELQDLCGKKPIETCALPDKTVSNGSYVPQAEAFAAKLMSHFGVA